MAYTELHPSSMIFQHHTRGNQGTTIEEIKYSVLWIVTDLTPGPRLMEPLLAGTALVAVAKGASMKPMLVLDSSCPEIACEWK